MVVSRQKLLPQWGHIDEPHSQPAAELPTCRCFASDTSNETHGPNPVPHRITHPHHISSHDLSKLWAEGP